MSEIAHLPHIRQNGKKGDQTHLLLLLLHLLLLMRMRLVLRLERLHSLTLTLILLRSNHRRILSSRA